MNTSAAPGPTPRAGRSRTRLGALLAAVALLATVALSVGTARPVAATETAGCVTGSIGCYPRMTFGVATYRLPNSTTALTTFETALGRNPDMGLTFTSFLYPFNVTGLRDLARSGITPLITWEPWDPTAPSTNRYALRDITAGVHDTYLREQAARIRDIGAPVAIRFAHEMNGSWYPWGAGVNGNTPQDYVDAYRHVHDLFAAQGITNVTWVWAPAALDSANPPDLAGFYPGDAYVDWAGMTAYFDQTTDTWANAVAPTLRRLDAVTPTKPFLLAETGVLPGANRPAMMHDLLDHLLVTPRAIGFVWFDISSRQDWRIDDDPAALTAMREVLASGWYPAPGTTFAPPAPLGITAPVVQGTAAVGSTLTATAGTWRGATSTTGRWLLCDATGAACAPQGTTAPSFVLGADAVGRTVRFEVTATGDGGTTTATSAATGTVAGGAPATPARPVVETRSGGARIVLPTAPAGTTHWQLTLDGTPLPLVPVGTAETAVSGLVDGTSHSLALSAACVTGGGTFTSAPTTGTFTPMPAPAAPTVAVTGPTASFTLPRAPLGTETWILKVGGATSRLAGTATTASVPVPTGTPVTWSLVAEAGTWGAAPDGGTTVPRTGTFTALATPAAPGVQPGVGAVTFTLPPAPVGTTAWRLAVAGTTYPDQPVGTASYTASGLAKGATVAWSLTAVNAGARSASVTGQVTTLRKASPSQRVGRILGTAFHVPDVTSSGPKR